MYAFRKPVTAGTFEEHQMFGFGLKSVLVISQLAGYMLSKFIGVKVVSEMRREHRAAAIVLLILVAETALLGFAYAPMILKVPLLFLNGLPLGMVFGIVLAYLEGRRQTEALSAVLCASFIVSSGVVKSVGRWLIEDLGVSEFRMPMLVGLIFLVPLVISVWLLQMTPPPDRVDLEQRSERREMTGADRRQFWTAYWPGLTLLVFVYVVLTVIRTIRDDFGVEIWRDLGVSETPSVFARSELLVAIIVTGFNALAIWIRCNKSAVSLAILLMGGGFLVVGGSALLQSADQVTPFVFMVACGIGLYIPYVAFHTTVFERLVAASRHPANVVFLMYVADALGYLGYAAALTMRMTFQSPGTVLPSFRGALLVSSLVSAVALGIALIYFRSVLIPKSTPDDGSGVDTADPPSIASGHAQ